MPDTPSIQPIDGHTISLERIEADHGTVYRPSIDGVPSNLYVVQPATHSLTIGLETDFQQLMQQLNDSFPGTGRLVDLEFVYRVDTAGMGEICDAGREVKKLGTDFFWICNYMGVKTGADGRMSDLVDIFQYPKVMPIIRQTLEEGIHAYMKHCARAGTTPRSANPVHPRAQDL